MSTSFVAPFFHIVTAKERLLPCFSQDATSPDMDKEEILRFEIAEIVQRILLLLNASRCLVPCVKWYTSQLVCVTKAWHNVDRSDPGFPVPASLVGYSKQGQSFQATLGNTTPKKKGVLWLIKFRVS